MTTIPTGRFVWFEYATQDLANAQGFFGELFNWGSQAVPMPQGAYTMIAAGPTTIGGYLPATPGAPPQWLSHLQVTDVEASVKQAVALGGRIIKPAFAIGVGVIAVIADPLGGTFALWQPVNRAPGDGYAHTAGTFCWNELHSADPAASAAFYQAIGGFELEAMGPYLVLKKDGLPRAGITKSSMPQSWLPYVQVESCAKSLEKAQKLGATIAMPLTTMPDVGTFAVFIDPAGGSLGVLQPTSRS